MFRNSTITDLFLFVFTQLILHYLTYLVTGYYVILKILFKKIIYKEDKDNIIEHSGK